MLTGRGIFLGKDGLFYRTAGTSSFNLTTCETLCAATPGFRLPEAKTAKVMTYIKTRRCSKNDYS